MLQRIREELGQTSAWYPSRSLLTMNSRESKTFFSLGDCTTFQKTGPIGEHQSYLQLVDLQGSAEKKVKTYSGGMKRRLQLAMGLIHDPRVLFLDEPSLGLDIQTRSKMWEYLRKLNSENGVTIFMTTHYLEEADALCDRVAIIDGGAIKVAGSPSELKTMLGGDLLSIQVSEGPDITRFLEEVQGVKEVRKLENSAYQVKIPHVEKALPEIVEGVSERGLKITDISFSRPTLDQVFLQVTGRKLRDGDSEAHAPLVAPVLTEKLVN